MLQSIIARVRSLFAWWFADIQKRKSFVGKAASLLIGLFVLCCVGSFGLAAVRGTGQAVGLVAANTPTAQPTGTSVATSVPVVAPTNAPATEAPTAEVLAQLATDAPTNTP